jgi:hypothetical protein
MQFALLAEGLAAGGRHLLEHKETHVVTGTGIAGAWIP